MKLFAIICLVLATVVADECPAKLLQALTKNVKSYLKGISKNAKDIKMNCSYEHDSNIFNLEHHVKAETTFKKRKLTIDMKTHSSMFDLYNFTDFNGSLCHSKMSDLKESKDKKVIMNTFMKKYAKDISPGDVRKTTKNGQICYRADIAKKRRRKIRRSLI